MGHIWVKFLKDHESYKTGDVVKFDKTAGDALVALKYAEVTEVKEDDVISEVLKGIQTTFTDAITKATEATIKTIGEKVDKTFKLPAVPKDHEEEGKGGFKSLQEMLVCVKNSKNNMDPRLTTLVTKGDPSGMNTADDVEGGFLIPETHASGIWEQAVEENPIFQRTDKRTTAGNSLKITAWSKESLLRAHRYAGIQTYWMDEADAYTASQMKLRQMRLELKKLGCLVYVTEEELSDAGANLEGPITAKCGDSIRFEINDSFLNGSGVGKPQGLLNSEATIFVGLEPNQQDSELRFGNIIKMYNRMPARFRGGAVWCMHPSVYEMLFYISFKDNTNNPWPMFVPPMTGLTNAPNGTLMGRPIEIFDYMPAPGYKGCLAFLNFSQYATLTKAGGGIKSASSIHVRFLWDEIAYKFSFRIDGQSLWPSAQQDLNGGVLRSPFIALDEVITGATSSGL